MHDGEDPAPGPDDPTPPAPRRSRRLLPAVGMVLVAVLAGTVALVVTDGRSEPLAEPAAAATVAPVRTTAATPFESATQALHVHAKALLAGDEKGWLAAVDPKQPKLRARYRTLYRSLRALGISHFEYHPYIIDAGKAGANAVGVGATIAYCFSLDTCPGYVEAPWDGPPKIGQKLILKRAGGRYVITRLDQADEPNGLQPTPWERTDLVFAQGRRVTVAAPRNRANYLKQVLPLADQAAAVNDRFAAYLGTRQKRYRVYLADRKSWKSWYGGEKGKWTIGYAVPLNDAQIDVVLKADELMSDRAELADTIRHEMGHVVTLHGVAQRDHDEDLWLSEGIAEYIGSAPAPATSSWRRGSVRAKVRSGKRPTSMAVKAPGAKARSEDVDAFYGLGHFAVDCMGEKFGERKLFDFVRLALRQDNTYDQASREAFGKPFKTVDKACVSWIRQQA